jgi:hypothetical protein
MTPPFTIIHLDGVPAIVSARGLVAVMHAGHGLTREEDAKLLVHQLNHYDELVHQLTDLVGFVHKFGATYDRNAFMRAAEGYIMAAQAAINKAKGTP